MRIECRELQRGETQRDKCRERKIIESRERQRKLRAESYNEERMRERERERER